VNKDVYTLTQACRYCIQPVIYNYRPESLIQCRALLQIFCCCRCLSLSHYFPLVFGESVAAASATKRHFAFTS